MKKLVSPTITYEWLAEKSIGFLLVLSMLLVTDMEIFGFPLYTFLLLVTASFRMMAKMISASGKGGTFFFIKYPTDTAAVMAILYAVFLAVMKLFSSAEDGSIDFSWNAEVIALAILCLLFSSGMQFKFLYLDLLLYSALPAVGSYLFFHLTDGWESSRLEAVFADSGVWASYFLLVSMIAVYGYCFCRDRMRSFFYLLMAGVGFFALFLNQNVISLWLMGIYFIAIPVMLRPTAVLVKRVMQLCFLYWFMLSNMSLLTEYTQMIRQELFYTLEHSVYLDLLMATGGIFFFYYWERIPEGMDLERLVLRKMQKGYRFLLKITVLLFVVILVNGNKWNIFSGGIANDALNSFAIPLVEAVKEGESVFLFCFQKIGAASGIFLLFCTVLFFDRVCRNYQVDKPDTGMLILISGIFFVQLLFWNPGIRNTVVYFYLLMMAAFYKEERKEVCAVGIKTSDLVREDAGAGQADWH